MLFNSIDFAIFLPIVFSIYWFASSKNIRLQNLILIISSYIFYAWWDYKFLSLIILSTVADYTIALQLKSERRPRKRTLLLWSSVVINIGILFFFKYYNFFIESFTNSFSFFGWSVKHQTLNIILPVGISFYTFQTLSYTIDAYRNNIKPTRDFLAFSAFVCFFPQLVAGPIERAKNFLPQFITKRNFNQVLAIDGLRQILWGLFKKIVIADNCALYVDTIFSSSENYSGQTLILGSVLFAFQIYGDFSGYTDIAIGTSRLFGFNLKRNFAFPYFSRDIAEFWRRWHISLSSWFKDYLYIPLGGSKTSKLKAIRNIFIVFLVSGFWHGANWTYIFWGGLNALYFIPIFLLGKNRINTENISTNRRIPSLKIAFAIFITFSLTTFAWIFFRSTSIANAFTYIQGIFSFSSTEIFIAEVKFLSKGAAIIYTCVCVVIMLISEWLQRSKNHALENIELNVTKAVRWLLYYSIIVLILYFSTNQQEFIYFQF